MKARIPKAYAALPKWQKDKVCEYMTQIAADEALRSYNRDIGIVLEQYLMMCCVSLHRNWGWGERRCTMFLASMRRIFRENLAYVAKGVQNEMLQGQIEEIFKKNGWPHDAFTDITGELNPEYKEKCNKEKEA